MFAVLCPACRGYKKSPGYSCDCRTTPESSSTYCTPLFEWCSTVAAPLEPVGAQMGASELQFNRNGASEAVLTLRDYCSHIMKRLACLGILQGQYVSKSSGAPVRLHRIQPRLATPNRSSCICLLHCSAASDCRMQVLDHSAIYALT